MLLSYYLKTKLTNDNEYIKSTKGIKIIIANKITKEERIVYDISGNLGYNSLGHNWINEKLKEIDIPIILQSSFYREKEQELSDLLTETFKFDFSFQANTGHEVVEIFLSMNKDKNIYKLKNEYHGRTKGILNIKEVKNLNKKLKTGDALIFEPFKGKEGGFKKMSEDEVNFIKSSQENGALICADEIQTSFFKVGKLLASEYYKIKPDVVLLGKPLAQGLPISAILTNTDSNFKWSSTFSGNEVINSIAIKSVKEHIKRKNEFMDKSKLFERTIKKVVGNNVFGFSGTFISFALFEDYMDNKNTPLMFYSYINSPDKFKFLCPIVISKNEIYKVSNLLSNYIYKYQ